MNNTANYIKQRLSLREPLRESLDIVAELCDLLELKKEVDLVAELEKVKNLHPTCTDFERTFPSLCFSIATGVGKTRLMGACIAYLYQQKKIRNFFVLAPNLTIYEKLKSDFGDPANPKYVFNGISDFVHNRPVIITGDNYDEQGGLFGDNEIRINVFNISKFNREATPASKGKDKGKPPRIKRLSEYLGQSYWSYLSGLKDLVILMDEAHRYHADASQAAINELQPVLGLELSATPIDEKGNQFKNVVYEYSLAKALVDGKYVKNPAIATRKNFNPKEYTDEEVERFKLEDSINIHEDTKNELELYARNNNVKQVKPFVLVVCPNIAHAKEVHEYLSSEHFFNGAYKGKVLQIDSSASDEANIQLLSTVEDFTNPIEIVIHVNMLAEGWDVTNLYTICPLRKGDSIKLVEQTIGRGLRLPYNGERTGVDKVDKLTVVSHDNFDKVIEAAKDKNSIFNKLTLVEIPTDELGIKTEVVSSINKNDAAIEVEEKKIEAITDEKQKQKARTSLDAKKAVLNAVEKVSQRPEVQKLDDFEKPEVKELVIKEIEKGLDMGQANLFRAQLIEEAIEQYMPIVTAYKQNIIEIPRFTLIPDDVKVWFEDFDLDTTGFNFRLLQEEIIRRGLKDDNTDTIGVTQGAFVNDRLDNQLINEVLNYPELFYDRDKVLLRKLANQALTVLENTLEDKSQLTALLRQHKKFLADKMYVQLMTHFRMEELTFKTSEVLPFVEILRWNFTALKEGGYKDYRDAVPPSEVKRYVYRGFLKACHFEYKFDSKTEKDFAFILENDNKILKWLRPAPNQFRIDWNTNGNRYEPDFIVETTAEIFMVETKAAKDMTQEEVLLKQKAAKEYCARASEYTKTSGGKPWRYLLLPHDIILSNMTFEFLVERYGAKI